jgi:L-amino acid N-acyltransferase YncA
MAAMFIRPATLADTPAILAIIAPVIRAGETYALDPAMSEAAMADYWLGADRATFVAEDGGLVLGTYYLRANQAGGGAHVANCGYMVDAAARGKGAARAMAAHSFDAAREAGFAAMQFNFVVSSNKAAVHLWQDMGFGIVGRLPRAFDHPREGRVDALVMFREL